MSAADFSKQLATLRVGNLVRGRGTRGTDAVEPYHDRVRDAVVEHFDREKRQRLHRRLAIALEKSGAETTDPQSLVRHFEAAGDFERAARNAQEAAKRSMEALAFDRAAELYRTAVRLGQHKGERLRGLRICLGDALTSAGRGAEAADVYLEAAEGADPATRRECQTQAAEQLLVTGHMERGLSALEALLAEAGASLPATPRRALWSLLWQRAKLRMRGLGWTERHEREIADSDLVRLDVYRVASETLGVIDNIRGADFQSRSLVLALRLGEPTRIARALVMESIYHSIQGQRGAAYARKLLERARRTIEDDHDAYVSAFCLLGDGLASHFAGQFPSAAAKMMEAETQFRDQPRAVTWELNTLRMVRLATLRLMGSIGEQCRLADSYVRDAQRRGDLFAETSFRRGNHVRWLARDQPDGIIRDFEQTSWTPPERGYHFQHFMEIVARAELAMYADTSGEVPQELRGSFTRLKRSLMLRIQLVRVWAHGIWGRLALVRSRSDAERKHSLKLAARCARQLHRERVGYAEVWSLLLRAGIATRESTPERTVQLLRQAETEAEANNMCFDLAGARIRLGHLLGGDEGAALIAKGEEWMTAEDIVNPGRMIELVAPGFDPAG